MQEIKITNPDKILFPKQKIKKLDIIKYYIEIAELMLPYVKNRLLSVIKCHENIEKECFFKKHPTTEIEFLHTKKKKRKSIFISQTLPNLYIRHN